MRVMSEVLCACYTGKTRAPLQEAKTIPSFDFAKCFDRIPHGIMLQLVSEMGLPPTLLRPIRVRGTYRCEWLGFGGEASPSDE